MPAAFTGESRGSVEVSGSHRQMTSHTEAAAALLLLEQARCVYVRCCLKMCPISVVLP